MSKCKCNEVNEEKDCKCHQEEHKCNCGNHKETETCNCGDDCNCNNAKESEYLELAQRIKAEFDNYKKRNAEISKISFENGVGTAVMKLLPAIDSFNQVMNAFNELGVKKIESVGCLFDPNLHNAVLTDNNENYGDEVILEEYQPGFIMGDKVIRHSVVKINKLS